MTQNEGKFAGKGRREGKIRKKTSTGRHWRRGARKPKGVEVRGWCGGMVGYNNLWGSSTIEEEASPLNRRKGLRGGGSSG